MSEIKPALTAEEVKRQELAHLEGYGHEPFHNSELYLRGSMVCVDNSGGEYGHSGLNALRVMALANIAANLASEGFTREDVSLIWDLINYVLDGVDHHAMVTRIKKGEAASLADRISALLPPEETK